MFPLLNKDYFLLKSINSLDALTDVQTSTLINHIKNTHNGIAIKVIFI